MEEEEEWRRKRGRWRRENLREEEKRETVEMEREEVGLTTGISNAFPLLLALFWAILL